MFTFWDWVLMGAVTVQAAAVAYIHSPRWKALVMFLPVPYPLTVMAVGKPVDATNVAGMGLLYVYARVVRLFYYRWRIPIIPAIVLAAAVYCAGGAVLSLLIPRTPAAFWAACGLAAAFTVFLLYHEKPRPEKGHRTPLPLWVKLPVIAAVVLCLMLVKQWLQGFATTFPLVALMGAYEARNSLYSVTNQFPRTLLFVMTITVTSRLTYAQVGLGHSLLLGWAVLLVELGVVMLREFQKNRAGSPMG